MGILEIPALLEVLVVMEQLVWTERMGRMEIPEQMALMEALEQMVQLVLMGRTGRMAPMVVAVAGAVMAEMQVTEELGQAEELMERYT